ncbi:MAG: maltose alpha-D-glucosyltransferase [Bryobacteraceae bacterium]
MKIRGSAQDPLWYKDAIIYETHVKAFFDGDNDGSGDFGGLVKKLDYIRDLGVTCLWLLPFFPSPLRDDGYDIADYNSVHPAYGSLDDFKALIAAAHECKLQVLIELVINHTSDQHPWFQAARAAPPGSPERDFYVWSDTDQKYKDARIIFTDTEKSNWSWDSEAQAYYWHRFFSHQPDLNFDNPAVIEEIVKAMRFWLDLGVDGLRLDAVPYLVEREGTNCENLPDTHEVIRRIRAVLDAHYSNRMLLAEANQWPQDVRPYFGDGDECSMAFHFPLMPRIFMALRLEDRHPIVEIMAQTPAIPDNCQWALFLRNHDELTLEMVTDEERDYMYLAYSADPRMRLNVGIRRRLAPLMENNRRRIELLNSLLFTFPGTPIIYYGDEIGMGDNIYLGDRNGVRTPMQWSADRNAGFSRANPAKLYSPLVIDAVYGYDAINVEAQQSDPSSLLQWMRNMIAMRKLFKVFGRGTLEFLSPANRKVLAYLRCDQNDRILCLANLSRFAQPVELDLCAFAGTIPVEMLGYTEFPQITRAPYPLTLGPYAFYWFELQGTPELAEVRTPEAELEDQDALYVAGDWGNVLEGRAKEKLERVFLPRFLPNQRWFGGKAGKIAATRIRDSAWLVPGDLPAALVLVNVEYEAGGAETYHIPMAVIREPEADVPQKAVICPISGRGDRLLLVDGMSEDAVCRALLTAIEHGGEMPSAQGAMVAFPTPALAELHNDSAPLSVLRTGAEQSNSSVILGDRLIMKVYRRLEIGPNPDYELGRYLTERAGFTRTPRIGGAIEYRAGNAEPGILALLQELVPNQGDGWSVAMEDLGRFYEEAGAFELTPEEMAAPGPLFDVAREEIPVHARHTMGLHVDAAATLGRRSAEMHLALGQPTEDPAFAPEPFDAADLAGLSVQARKQAQKLFDTLRFSLATLPDDVVDRAAWVLGQRRKVLDRFRELENMGAQGARIRVHGDYHLGQVLWVENDYILIDFEGEPARDLAERRTKQSPLKDVAGMLRSYSYAAYAGLVNYTARRADDYAQLLPWAEYWERWTCAAFLKAYRETAGDAGFLPKDEAGFRKLLQFFLLDKALYELAYELNNRPAWVRIPINGLLALI